MCKMCKNCLNFKQFLHIRIHQICDILQLYMKEEALKPPEAAGAIFVPFLLGWVFT